MSITINIPGAHPIPRAWNRQSPDDNFWLRFDHYPTHGLTASCSGVPLGVTPIWNVSYTLAGASGLSRPPMPSYAALCRIDRPSQPARIEVSCAAGSETQRAILWALSGRILFHTQGPVSAENRSWPAVARELRMGTAHRPRLGLRTWVDQETGERSYAAIIEIVGAVEPADVPAPFHLVRRVLHVATRTSDGSVIPPPPDMNDDTNAGFLQDMTLSSRGRVYDIDAPSSQFGSQDAVGTRHEWELLFEQMLVIGPLESGRGARARAIAQHRVVSDPRVWRAYFNATVVAEESAPSVEMHGYVGP